MINKTILISGGFGAIGSNLTKKLSANNTVIIIDNSSSGELENLEINDKLIIYKNDIRDMEILASIFKKYSVDFIYHLAANFANQNSVDNPLLDLDVNGKGTLLLLKFAQEYGVKKFIYASTSGVYGSKIDVMRETTHGELETPYYIHKMLGEYYTEYYKNQFGLNIVNIRIFNSYGPGEKWGKYRNVIPNFFYKAINNQPLTITGTGEETRDFTFVDDIVEGFILAGKKDEANGEIINLGTGKETKIITLAKYINEITNNKAGIEFINRRDWDGVLKRKAVNEKAKKLLNWEPKIDLEDGLKIYYTWLKEKIK